MNNNLLTLSLVNFQNPEVIFLYTSNLSPDVANPRAVESTFGSERIGTLLPGQFNLMNFVPPSTTIELLLAIYFPTNLIQILKCVSDPAVLIG
jgi:hypothetical protein